jgi:predicted Zn-dependent protease
VCALLCALASSPSCWSSPVEHIPESTSAYDVLPSEAAQRFDAARLNMSAGRLDLARPALEALRRDFPDNIYVGIWLQETEIEQRALADSANATQAAPVNDAARAEGARATSATPLNTAHDPRLDEMRQRYRRAAEESPSVARLVLAARLEDDELAANVLLDRAQTRDPHCAWTHYARAWFAARANRWPEVQSEIAAAKEADPGHLPTRWLDAWMLARGGGVREAISSLEGWLDRARGDLRLDVRLVREAELDLALLWILAGDAKRSRDILDALGDKEVDPGRKWAAMAPVETALDNEREALAAAQRAEQGAPGEILPVVQQALLYESWLGNAEAAEAAWTRALALARGSSDLGALLERLRARTHVERLRAAREKKKEGAAAG